MSMFWHEQHRCKVKLQLDTATKLKANAARLQLDVQMGDSLSFTCKYLWQHLPD